jgi:hypothetical protein
MITIRTQEKLKTIRDAVKRGKIPRQPDDVIGFNMSSYTNVKKNTMCMAGYLYAIERNQTVKNVAIDSEYFCLCIADYGELIGLDAEMSRLLFVGIGDYNLKTSLAEHIPLSIITREDAVEVLDILIETGEVTWETINNKYKK